MLCRWNRDILGVRQGRKAEKTCEDGSPAVQATHSDSGSLFEEPELCDGKSPGFVRITATAGLSYCKNTHHQKTPAAFLISVGLLTGRPWPAGATCSETAVLHAVPLKVDVEPLDRLLLSLRLLRSCFNFSINRYIIHFVQLPT